MPSNSFVYIFLGQVLPTRAMVTLPENHVRLIHPEAKIDGDCIINIHSSQVAVRFISNVNNLDLLKLRNSIYDVVSVQLDVLGYVTGCGYNLDIIQVIDLNDDLTTTFGVHIPVLQNENRTVDEKVFSLFADKRGNHLRLCLADLREAIINHRDTGFLLYRAIEALMQSFRTNNTHIKNEKKVAWQALRSELSISENDIRRLEEIAKDFRHGETKYISGDERAELFIIAWAIVDKYIKYACNGYKVTKNQI